MKWRRWGVTTISLDPCLTYVCSASLFFVIFFFLSLTPSWHSSHSEPFISSVFFFFLPNKALVCLFNAADMAMIFASRHFLSSVALWLLWYPKILQEHGFIAVSSINSLIFHWKLHSLVCTNDHNKLLLCLHNILNPDWIAGYHPHLSYLFALAFVIASCPAYSQIFDNLPTR